MAPQKTKKRKKRKRTGVWVLSGQTQSRPFQDLWLIPPPERHPLFLVVPLSACEMLKWEKEKESKTREKERERERENEKEENRREKKTADRSLDINRHPKKSFKETEEKRILHHK